MKKIRYLFEQKILDFVRVPLIIRQEFMQEAVQKNHLSLLVICMIVFGTEFYNIIRVLFWSKSGLGTVNNRIYFGMYCVLLIIAGLWLLLRRTLNRASLKLQWRSQYAVITLIFLWHIGLNTYDLYRDPTSGVTVLTTAILGLSLFIQAPPFFSLSCFATGYILFRILTVPMLAMGEIINITITFVVALSISISQAHHVSVSIQQRKQIIEINTQLQNLLKLDPLTGLLNKTAVQYRVEQHLRRVEQTGGLTLFMIDLDDFKSVNDRYGHPCGDQLLVETAQQLRLVFPEALGLGRIGGDEFAAIFSCPLDESRVTTLGEQIIHALAGFQWQGHPIAIQCSVGACVCTDPYVTYQEIYTQTDRMLYLAKKGGKGRICMYHIAVSDPIYPVATIMGQKEPS